MSNLRIRLPYGRVLTLTDILRFVFNLNDTDLSIMSMILEEGKATAEELTRRLKYNRSSVNRSLLKLLHLGLIDRETVHVEGKIGRPMYTYKARKAEEVREVLRSRVKICAEAALKLIDEIL